MEKKKLLLVAVWVGVFLVIVVGAAILVFSPNGKPSVGTDWRSPNGAGLAAVQPATADPREMLNNEELRGLQSPAAQPNAGNDLTIDRNTGTVISVQRPQAAAVPDSTETPAAQAAPKPVETPPAQAAPPKESARKPVAPVVTPASPRPAASAAPPSKKTSNNF